MSSFWKTKTFIYLFILLKNKSRHYCITFIPGYLELRYWLRSHTFPAHRYVNIGSLSSINKRPSIIFVWSGSPHLLLGLVWKPDDVLRHIYADLSKILKGSQTFKHRRTLNSFWVITCANYVCMGLLRWRGITTELYMLPKYCIKYSSRALAGFILFLSSLVWGFSGPDMNPLRVGNIFVPYLPLNGT